MSVRLLSIRRPRPARRIFRLAVPGRPGDALLPLVLPLLVLVAWQVAAAQGWLAEQILPAPSLVLTTFLDLLRDGDIAANLKISLWRISVGFACGAGLGLVFGTWLGLSRRVEAYGGPLFRALAQVPSLGWVPILILIFGLDEILKVVIIAKACFVPTALATSQAIRNIPPAYLEVGRVLRLRPRTFIFRLIVPATLPTMFSGIRLALSHAWIALVTVEMLAATEGVGYMMVWGRTLFQIDIVIAGMAVIGVIGLLLDTGLIRIEQRLRRWEGPRG